MRIITFFRHLILVLLSLTYCLQLSAQTAAPVEAPPAANAPAANDKWEKAIAALEAGDKSNPPPKKAVVFVGSSTLRLWKAMQADFPEIPVINRGFGGSQMSDVVKYEDRIVIAYDPRVVVTYVGGNDLFYNNTPAQVMDQYKLFDTALRKTLPEVTIIHVSLSPTIKRENQENLVREFNGLLSAYVKEQPKMIFVDSYSKLIGPDGKPQDKMLKEDKLHPSPEGYRVLTEMIKPVVDKAYVDAGGTLLPAPAAK